MDKNEAYRIGTTISFIVSQLMKKECQENLTRTRHTEGRKTNLTME